MTYTYCSDCQCKVCPGRQPEFWQQWSLDYQYSRQLESTKSPCWILCYPRTGSNYLCWCYNLSANFVPCFAEWLNPPVNHRPADDDCSHLYVPWRMWSSIKPTEVVYREKVQPLLDRLPPYLKIHCCDYDEFFTPEHYHQIIQKLPGIKFVRLRRRDLIACAVSYYLAMETGVFTATDDKTVSDQAQIRVKVDEEKLLQCFEWMVDWDEYWGYFLQGGDHIEIYYEDLVTDPEVAKQACEYIGFPSDHLEGRLSRIQEKKLRHPQTPGLISLLKIKLANNPRI